MADRVLFHLNGNILEGTETVLEDGKTYRQTWPAGSHIRLYMVKYGRIELEQLPDGRYAYAPKNIMGREVRRIETEWIPVADDGNDG